MTIGYTVVPTLRLVFVRASGELTHDQLGRLAEALRGERSFQPDFNVLADLRQVTTIAVTAGHVRSGIASAFAPHARRAVIAIPSEAFGMARMYELTSGLEASLKIFSDPAGALEWLGVDTTTPWPAPFPDTEIGST